MINNHFVYLVSTTVIVMAFLNVMHISAGDITAITDGQRTIFWGSKGTGAFLSQAHSKPDEASRAVTFSVIETSGSKGTGVFLPSNSAPGTASRSAGTGASRQRGFPRPGRVSSKASSRAPETGNSPSCFIHSAILHAGGGEKGTFSMPAYFHFSFYSLILTGLHSLALEKNPNSELSEDRSTYPHSELPEDLYTDPYYEPIESYLPSGFLDIEEKKPHPKS
ncbi:hypothetical protein Pst134EA_027907 [Puccinia striiformis f. sp. tritici]|uniref:hypothetical protein n=1 Tax=Puccinia striiformis f. sp. tritici TaxID=168172 RepID=UPI0020077BDE|nr:hypothetical protein Pst134EA_027907 [Puccinia striiformis f. sp. tritici]KAH9448605.1 hypothetical protein Pst134EA_027907 [Puccinia striiformis f. sp. tritici]KAI9607976.1 hypothetical protein H4Q26_005428 [Puccinia striiformis f. sp. tritici PST-130]